MKPELKKAWIDNLRGSDFKQGRGSLRKSTDKGDEYCCLGVLCEVAGRGWVTEYKDEAETVYGVATYDINLRTGKRVREIYSEMPPEKFLEKLGLDYGDAENLATMNDGGDSFKKIARYIEKNL